MILFCDECKAAGETAVLTEGNKVTICCTAGGHVVREYDNVTSIRVVPKNSGHIKNVENY